MIACKYSRRMQVTTDCLVSADMLCRVCACMQTQHKVQLDARDKGQPPAGQQGPYQVTPALPVPTAAFVSIAALDADVEHLAIKLLCQSNIDA